MVALTARFAVLAAFISLASLSVAPLSASAVAIPSKATRDDALTLPMPSSSDDNKNATEQENPNQARFNTWPDVKAFARLVQLKKKRQLHDDSRHAQQYFHGRRSRVMVSSQHGASYYVPPASMHGKRAEHKGDLGVIDVTSPDSKTPNGKKLGSLQESQRPDGTYVFNVSEHNATQLYLVNAPTPSRVQSGDPASASLVMLVVPKAESETGEQTDFCTTYSNDDSAPEPLTLEKCVYAQPNEEANSTTSQVFSYDDKTGIVRPFSTKPALDASEGAQGVLQRDEPATNVTLVFVRAAPQAADVEDIATTPAAVTETSTMTTTVTVTGTSTATASAADIDATPSAEFPSSSIVPASTSTMDDVSSPTPVPVGALEVQVVGSSSSLAATESMISSSEAAAPTATTTAINAEDVAASIAAPSTAPADVSSTVAPSASVEPSTTATPAAAAEEESTTAIVSSTESSIATAAPTASGFSTEPYSWVFRRE